MKESIFDFYHREIEPKAFDFMNSLLPEMELKPNGHKWTSAKKLYGDPANKPNPQKSYITDPKYIGMQHIRIREQGESTAPDLIDYIQKRESLSKIDAIKWIAKVMNIDIPETAAEDEERRARRERQEKLSRILSEMKAALYTPQGSEVLQYLKGTDYKKKERGYSDEYIEDAPIGYIDTTMSCYEELKDILYYNTKVGEEKGLKKCSYTIKDKDGNKVGYGAGYTHRVAIAYYSEGEIKGFRFRTIFSKEEIAAFKDRFNFDLNFRKYLAAYIGEYDTQGSYPLNLPVAKLSAYNDKYLNFTIVEGDLDAYRGAYAGLLNVVAVGTSSIYQAQIKKLKAKGAKSLTLLMDTEELSETEGIDPLRSRQASEDRVAGAIERIAAEGLSPYVLYLPSPAGEKMDLDEYFKGLEGDELHAKAAALQEMIEDAESGFIFLYRRYEKEYKETRQNDRELKKFAKKTLQLTERQECDFVDRGRILKLFAEATGIDLRDKDIEAILNDSTIDAEETRRKAQETLQERIAAASEECTTDAAKAQETLRKALIEYDTATAEDLSEYNRIKSQEERKKKEEGAPIGIYTDFTFYAKEKEGGQYYSEKLLLPAQALTYICAPSGQGKTRLLENLAMQVLRNESDGSVLFFTLEESDTKIENAFLNLYINERLSEKENNILTLKKYKAEADIDKQRALFTAYDFDTFLRREREFNEKYILSGRLRIYYEPKGTINKIEKVIRYIKNTATPQTGAPIKAVFIDYIQRLKAEGNFYGDKKREMDSVTEILMSLSVELGIPFILSVQLNRQAASPLEMSINQVADAAEIERSGSVILLLFNSAFPPAGSSEFVRKESILEESDFRYTDKQLQNIRNYSKKLYDRAKEQNDSVDKMEGEGKKANKQTLNALYFSLRTGVQLEQPGKLYAVIAKNRDSVPDIEAVLNLSGNTGTITQGYRNPEQIAITLQKSGIVQELPTAASQPQPEEDDRVFKRPQPPADDPDPIPRNEDESEETPF